MTAESMPWVREGDRFRCTRHGETFSPPFSCRTCADDPGPEIADDIDGFTVLPPKGCLTTEELERWFVSIAREARNSARATAVRCVKHRDFHDEAAIAKHRECAIKAMRAAAELAHQREYQALVAAREKRIRDRSRGADH